jgi:hypothetical protein
MSDMVAAGPDDSGPAIARRFLRRRLVRDVSFLVVGLLLTAAAVTGFVRAAAVSADLADTGIRATATAVDVRQGSLPLHLDDQIDVTFRSKGDRAVTARCYTTSADQFAPGQPVVIVYDPQNPPRAQLADNPDLGPIAAPLTIALILGLSCAIPAALSSYHRRGAQAALTTTPKPMTATKFNRNHMSLRSPEAAHDTLELKARGQLSHFPKESTKVQVFGQTTLIIVKTSPTPATATAKPPTKPKNT